MKFEDIIKNEDKIIIIQALRDFADRVQWAPVLYGEDIKIYIKASKFVTSWIEKNTNLIYRNGKKKLFLGLPLEDDLSRTNHEDLAIYVPGLSWEDETPRYIWDSFNDFTDSLHWDSIGTYTEAQDRWINSRK